MSESETDLFKKLRLAYKYLEIEYDLTQKEVVKMLNAKFNKHGKISYISTSYFNKYLKADKIEAGLNLPKLKSIVRSLDTLLKDKYNVAWNYKTESYESIDSLNLKQSKKRTQSLSGVWIGYTWNATMSDLTKKEWVYIFKMHIDENGKVVCSTESAKFESEIINIVENRAVIELTNHRRRLYIVIPIGVADEEHLKNAKVFQLAYTDTGDKRVKSGLAIIERAKDSYDSIKPGNIEVTKLNKPDFIDFIRNAQLLIS